LESGSWLGRFAALEVDGVGEPSSLSSGMNLFMNPIDKIQPELLVLSSIEQGMMVGTGVLYRVAE